jgi:hypothetical protein
MFERSISNPWNNKQVCWLLKNDFSENYWWDTLKRWGKNRITLFRPNEDKMSEYLNEFNAVKNKEYLGINRWLSISV